MSRQAFAAWANDGEIVVSVDPGAVRELLEQGAVETARTAVIHVFDRRLLAEPGGAQSRRQPLVPPPRDFAVEQKAEPFMMAKTVRLVGAGDFHEGLGHAVKAQGVELIEGRMFEQNRFS